MKFNGFSPIFSQFSALIRSYIFNISVAHFRAVFCSIAEHALRRQTGLDRPISDTNHGLFSALFSGQKSRGLISPRKWPFGKMPNPPNSQIKKYVLSHAIAALRYNQARCKRKTKRKEFSPCRSTLPPGTSAAPNFSPSPTGCIWAHRRPKAWTGWNLPCPEQWAGCVVTLHIRHADGTLAEPLELDEAGRVRRGPQLHRLGQRRVDAGRRQRRGLHRLHPARPV